MNRKHTHLHTYAHSIRLSVEERDALKRRLSAYMTFHPVRAERRAVRSLGSRIRAFVGACAAAVAVAMPVFAQGAMPGDMLYPVKVHFNEEIRATFASSSQERIAWQVERVERRMAEAQYLAREGRLTAAAEAIIADTLRSHAVGALEELERLGESDADRATEIKQVFETTLSEVTALIESFAAQQVSR